MENKRRIGLREIAALAPGYRGDRVWSPPAKVRSDKLHHLFIGPRKAGSESSRSASMDRLGRLTVPARRQSAFWVRSPMAPTRQRISSQNGTLKPYLTCATYILQMQSPDES
jgi:hypothetical protein